MQNDGGYDCNGAEEEEEDEDEDEEEEVNLADMVGHWRGCQVVDRQIGLAVPLRRLIYRL